MTSPIIEDPYRYKLIYVVRARNDSYRGLLKIGDATLACSLPRDAVERDCPPDCPALNAAAAARVREYMRTAGLEWQVLRTELALLDKGGGFRDHAVHSILRRSGFPREDLGESGAREWFRVTLPVALAAIRAAKAGRAVLSAKERAPTFVPLALWPNQREAVDLAKARFAAGASAVLWNAKMRFGKTLSAMTLIKEAGYRRVLICTHRPVVRKGWREEYANVFGDVDAYRFVDDEEGLRQEQGNVIYFASIQDLRGSQAVEGKFAKNADVFRTAWDLVIVDEAHEGTQTDLGATVIRKLTHGHDTKVLALSGTPYNILADFPVENTYTWDYVAEVRAKRAWDATNGCANPYAGLPDMRVFTYELSEHFRGNEALVTLDNTFCFSEFFRVSKVTGRFAHEQEVRKFLALLCGAHAESNYPFATEAHREALRHTLWKLPGVQECAALKALLDEDPVFGNFGVVNVAGEGDVDGDAEKALDAVRAAIARHTHTITLSCGRLTTGVTVPQWSGVLMLSGGDKVAAAAYLQTIFRVQSPDTDAEGRVKEACYVFDFAPDRLLTILPKMCVGKEDPAGAGGEPSRANVEEVLNFLPVIALKGSELHPYSVNDIFYAIKRSVAAKAIREGFSDNSIYRQEMLTRANIKAEDFANLKKIVGTLGRDQVPDAVTLAATGLSKTKKRTTRGTKPQKVPSSPEEEARRKEAEAERTAKETAISILRAISIRMPLLIYGAEGPHDEDIGLRDFMRAVDPVSWAEFMPKGVTWEVFERFIPYYDDEVFRVALKEIRARAKAADAYSPEGRVKAIASIFAAFRNPDKETVLTPWRVVNRHLADTLGGWCFYDEAYAEPLDAPRLVTRAAVTHAVFGNPAAKVLELNAKTGLYALWVAFSFYQARCEAARRRGGNLTRDRQQALWREVVREHLCIVCRTKMARAITKRTLLGYLPGEANIEVYEDIVGDLRNHTENSGKVLRNIRNPATWGQSGREAMHFNAIVGNPPYQASLGGASPLPIYHHFVNLAIAAADLVSLITPSRWFSTGTGLDDFREARLKDTHFRVLHDFRDSHLLFGRVDIKGGVNYFLWDKDWNGETELFLHESGTETRHSRRRLLEPGLDIFVRDERVLPILRKVLAKKETSFASILSSRDPFGYDIRLPGSMKVAAHKYSLRKTTKECVAFYYNRWREEGIGYVSYESVGAHPEWVDKPKVLLPKAWGTGDPRKSRIPAFIVEPPSVCTETYLTLTPFATRQEAENALRYIETKFFHFLVGIRKTSQNGAKGVYRFVPLQDFSRGWTDAALYAKYGLTAAEAAFVEATIPEAPRGKRG